MYGDIWGHRKLVSFLGDGVFYCTGKGGEAMTLKKMHWNPGNTLPFFCAE
jgi:hypothetical protein